MAKYKKPVCQGRTAKIYAKPKRSGVRNTDSDI
jgi:hypothetical protein